MAKSRDREICEAAQLMAPGPWIAEVQDEHFAIDGVVQAEVCDAETGLVAAELEPSAANFIAHNDPVRVAAMLDVVEAAENWRLGRDSGSGIVVALDRLDALDAPDKEGNDRCSSS